MTKCRVTPIFILSVPRSGSTLLQRLIASHPEVGTTNESWLLLPLLSAIRKDGASVSDFDHSTCRRALGQLIERLPRGKEDFFDAVRGYAEELYLSCGSGELYFVDKCPRYSLIVEQVLECFPNAKFIFQWRNPAAVAASAQRRWGGGRWRADVCRVDLHQGLPRLVQAYEAYADRILALRFEDLAGDPAREMRSVWSYLDLREIEPDMALLESGMGDSRGLSRYDGISTDPLFTWKEVYSNWFRRKWASSYLKGLGEDLVGTMGYDLESLVEEVHRSGHAGGQWRSSFVDLIWYLLSLAFIQVQPDSWKHSVVRSGERQTRVRLR